MNTDAWREKSKYISFCASPVGFRSRHGPSRMFRNIITRRCCAHGPVLLQPRPHRPAYSVAVLPKRESPTLGIRHSARSILITPLYYWWAAGSCPLCWNFRNTAGSSARRLTSCTRRLAGGRRYAWCCLSGFAPGQCRGQISINAEKRGLFTPSDGIALEVLGRSGLTGKRLGRRAFRDDGWRRRPAC